MQTNMKRIGTLLPAGLAAMFGLGGCNLNPFQAEENEAVLDFIYTSDLQEVDSIRFFQQYTYTYVNDQYVTIPTSSGDYLVELTRTCPELRQNRFTPEMVDYRDDNRTLRARFDTIRGCRIGKIYEVTAAQARELAELGDAPGEDVYLPGEGDEDAPAEAAGDAAGTEASEDRQETGTEPEQ
jgi:Family of unknown function (DUF6491)